MKELFHFPEKRKKKTSKNPHNYCSFDRLFLPTLPANSLSCKELAGI
jgi:hypothetical protein